MNASVKIKWPTPAEAEQIVRDEEIRNNFRILGARDGLINALLKVRNQIGHLTYYPIDPRYTRKIAERERILAPLRTLERGCVREYPCGSRGYDSKLAVAPTTDGAVK